MNTTTCSDARPIHKRKRYWVTIILVLLGLYAFFTIKSIIDELAYAMTPPDLPKYQHLPVEYINPNGWGSYSNQWFHHASQGTATLPIPYDWILALEEPKSSPWLIFIGQKKRFVEEYILRLGFIAGKKSWDNPDVLPVGIAQTQSIYFPGVDRQAAAAGFTCAACHTGQMIHKGKRYVIDGGPAMTDLGLLTTSLGAALAQTALSSKLVVFNGRFERFAKRVLGSNYNVLTRAKLKGELAATLAVLVKQSDTINVTEGFTRLDALNRIGNAVFANGMDRNRNYSPINAPVNYPHIWTTSWFDWVQYDASIMQPLIRNSGEALGVKAYVNVDAGFDNTTQDYVNQQAAYPNTEASLSERFASSIPIGSLVEIEDWIGGSHPYKRKSFDGLQGPAWPESFPSVDQDKVNAGKGLYTQLCQECHLPPISHKDFWGDKYWKEIIYKDSEGKTHKTLEKYLRVTVIPQNKIGTDPSQGNVLAKRTVDATGLNLDTDICTHPPKKIAPPGYTLAGWQQYLQENKQNTTPSYDDESCQKGDYKTDELGNNYCDWNLAYVPLNDSSTNSFALALGAFVQRTNDQWFKQNYVTSAEQQKVYEGNRPNCLQAGAGYKARPLNGVWATAPFLHNGSVATLYDLLLPQAERPVFVELGEQQFDTAKVGILQGKRIKKLNEKYSEGKQHYRHIADYSDGRFVLDTRELGNLNTGHSFDDKPKGTPGVIGRKLTDTERMTLIEYLKTL